MLSLLPVTNEQAVFGVKKLRECDSSMLRVISLLVSVS